MARLNLIKHLDSLTYRQVRFLFTGCSSGILPADGQRLYEFYLKNENQVVDLFLEDSVNHGKRLFYFWLIRGRIQANENELEKI